MPVGWLALLVHACTMVLLSVVAIHRLWLAVCAAKLKRRDTLNANSFPPVLVQLPLYNERHVAKRLIDSVCALEYPGKLRIQVLDDSTDGTHLLCESLVRTWRARGVEIELVHRVDRSGFKAGALAHGLSLTDEPLVAIFDADFVPPKNFLCELVPEFSHERVGMVQARWGHLNRDESSLTQVQAALLDAHFVNEHAGRAAMGCFFNFNGTAGIWRRSCIEDAGGWSGQTITEDLDLSYRAQLRGWEFVFRSDLVVPAELPRPVEAFKVQQHRWAKGSIETAMLLLPKILTAPTIGIRRKAEAVFHLAANLAYPLVWLLALVLPWSAAAIGQLGVWRFLGDLLFVGSMVSLAAFYVTAQKRCGVRRGTYGRVVWILAVGMGLCVNNTRAVIEALLKHRSPFVRTPKVGSSGGLFNAEFLPKVHWQAVVELCMTAYLVLCAILLLVTHEYLSVPFLLLFAAGFGWMGAGSLWGTTGMRKLRGASPPVGWPGVSETLTDSWTAKRIDA